MKAIDMLLVEDNEGDILLTKEALEERNIINRVDVARDGEEAINFLKEALKKGNLPEMILLDINLPKINGQEVLKFIKTSDGLKHIPVVMLTTSSSAKDINESYTNYVNAYIAKPLDANEFTEVVSKLEDFWINIVEFPKF